jgi:hypothetical protein
MVANHLVAFLARETAWFMFHQLPARQTNRLQFSGPSRSRGLVGELGVGQLYGKVRSATSERDTILFLGRAAVLHNFW